MIDKENKKLGRKVLTEKEENSLRKKANFNENFLSKKQEDLYYSF